MKHNIMENLFENKTKSNNLCFLTTYLQIQQIKDMCIQNDLIKKSSKFKRFLYIYIWMCIKNNVQTENEKC